MPAWWPRSLCLPASPDSVAGGLPQGHGGLGEHTTHSIACAPDPAAGGSPTCLALKRSALRGAGGVHGVNPLCRLLPPACSLVSGRLWSPEVFIGAQQGAGIWLRPSWRTSLWTGCSYSHSHSVLWGGTRSPGGWREVGDRRKRDEGVVPLVLPDAEWVAAMRVGAWEASKQTGLSSRIAGTIQGWMQPDMP